MTNKIIITWAGFERVSGHYWAHHDNGRMIISFDEYLEMKESINKTGSFIIEVPDLDMRPLSELLEDCL